METFRIIVLLFLIFILSLIIATILQITGAVQNVYQSAGYQYYHYFVHNETKAGWKLCKGFAFWFLVIVPEILYIQEIGFSWQLLLPTIIKYTLLCIVVYLGKKLLPKKTQKRLEVGYQQVKNYVVKVALFK